MTAVSCERSQRRGPGCYQHRRPTEHTALLWRNGMSARLCTALANPVQRQSAERRLLDGVHRNPANGCWEWHRHRSVKGYGKTSVGGSSRRISCLAHRLSYALFCGPIPDEQFVCHRCDNPRCCNPVHLFPGDQQANMDDMKAKGHSTQGERSAFAKLTTADVLEIRRRYLAGEPVVAIAKPFGIQPRHISWVATGKAWGHVPGSVPARRPRRVYMTPNDVTVAKQLSANGMSKEEIGRRLGVSADAVRRRLQSTGGTS